MEFFSTLFNAAGDIATDINNQMTQADVKEQSAKFNEALNKMFYDMNNSNAYETFQQTYEDFFTEWTETVNANARTPQSAEYLTNMVNQAQASNKYNLLQSVKNSENNELLGIHERLINQIMNDDSLTTQDGINGIMELINNDYENNRIHGSDSYNNLTTKYINEYLSSRGLNAGLNILYSGGTLEEAYQEAVNRIDEEYSLPILQGGKLTPGEGNGFIQKDALKTQIRKQLQTEWNTRIIETQKNNASLLSEAYSKLRFMEGPDLLNGINQTLSMMDTMNGNKLSESDRVSYSDRLYKLLQTLEDPNQTTASGNSKVKVTYCQMLTDPDAWVDYVLNGDIDNINCLQEAIVTASYEMYKQETGEDIPLSQFIANNQKDINKILDTAIKSNILPPSAKALVNSFNNVFNSYVKRVKNLEKDSDVKDYFEKNGQYYDVVIADAKEALLDLIYACKFSDKNEVDNLIPQFENRINAMFLGGLSENLDTTRKFGRSSEKAMADTISALADEGSAYTVNDSRYIKTRNVFAPGVQEKASEVAQYTVDKLQEYGILPKELSENFELKEDGSDNGFGWSYENTLYDINGTPIVMLDNGDQYKMVAEGDKPKLVMKANGSKDWVEVQNANQNATEDAKQAAAAERKTNQYNSSIDKINDNDAMFLIAESGIVPAGYSKATWDNYDEDTKVNNLATLLKNNPAYFQQLKSQAQEMAKSGQMSTRTDEATIREIASDLLSSQKGAPPDWKESFGHKWAQANVKIRQQAWYEWAKKNPEEAKKLLGK